MGLFLFFLKAQLVAVPASCRGQPVGVWLWEKWQQSCFCRSIVSSSHRLTKIPPALSRCILTLSAALSQRCQVSAFAGPRRKHVVQQTCGALGVSASPASVPVKGFDTYCWSNGFPFIFITIYIVRCRSRPRTNEGAHVLSKQVWSNSKKLYVLVVYLQPFI